MNLILINFLFSGNVKRALFQPSETYYNKLNKHLESERKKVLDQDEIVQDSAISTVSSHTASTKTWQVTESQMKYETSRF